MDGKRSVCVMTLHPLAGVGGEEQVTRDLVSLLESMGYGVTVVEPCSDKELDLVRRGLLRLARVLRASDVLWGWWLGRRVAAQPWDWVLVNSGAGWSLSGVMSAGLFHGTIAGYQRAMSAQGAMKSVTSYKLALVDSKLERWSARKRQIVIAVSRSTSEELRTHYGVEATAIIPNMVDTVRFRPGTPGERKRLRNHFKLPENDVIGIFVGRGTEHKGLTTLKRLLGGPLECGGLVVVSPTPLNLGARNVYEFTGVSGAALADLYRACDFALLPSRWEACSLVLAEAMASGLVPIVSAVGHARELRSVSALAPFVIEDPGDVAAFAAAVRLVMRTEARSTAQGAARSVAVQWHGKENFAMAYQAIFGLLERDGSQTPANMVT